MSIPAHGRTKELEELKLAWATLERRVAQQNELLLVDRKRRTLRAQLAPLAVGQVLQMLFGIAATGVGVWLWHSHDEAPLVVASGMALHLYGIAVTIVGFLVLGHLARLDGSQPVVELQRRVLLLRRAVLIGGAIAGLPWWILWIVPFAVPIALHQGPATTPEAPLWLLANLGVGVVGLVGTLLFRAWLRRPDHADLARRLADAAAGRGLRRVQQELDALRAFEAD